MEKKKLSKEAITKTILVIVDRYRTNDGFTLVKDNLQDIGIDLLSQVGMITDCNQAFGISIALTEEFGTVRDIVSRCVEEINTKSAAV